MPTVGALAQPVGTEYRESRLHMILGYYRRDL